MKRQNSKLSFKRNASKENITPRSAVSKSSKVEDVNFNFINEKALASLDPSLLDLCDELESLGGGIKTKIESIKTEIVACS